MSQASDAQMRKPTPMSNFSYSTTVVSFFAALAGVSMMRYMHSAREDWFALKRLALWE